jgi:hypothetical protein
MCGLGNAYASEDETYTDLSENLKVRYYSGRAMAQVVSRRPIMAEARVRTRVNPCGICGGQSGIGPGFSPSSSVSPVNIIPPSLSKLISSGECVIY